MKKLIMAAAISLSTVAFTSFTKPHSTQQIVANALKTNSFAEKVALKRVDFKNRADIGQAD